jgi:hypothetical protein
MRETIQMWKAKNQKGDVISKRYYDQLSSFILGKVKNSDGITLIELIEQANEEIAKDFGGRFSCLLLIVKKDLEVMDVIAIEKLPDRTQFISLKKRSTKKIKYMDKVRSVHYNPNNGYEYG